MVVAYLDCSCGIAGDMLVGAFLDAGLPLDELRMQLAKIPLEGYELEVCETRKKSLRALKFNVICQDDDVHRHYCDIKSMIEQSGLSEKVKSRALKIFKKLGEAEAKVHGVALDKVHFHEVGAVDSIIDICSVAVALEYFGVSSLYVSPINVGSGEVETQHGVMSVPTAATLELAKDMSIYSRHVEMEIATPTGMAVAAAFASGVGPMPNMVIEKSGCGAGTKDLPIANILRLVLGEVSSVGDEMEGSGDPVLLADQVVKIEADIDDMNPEWYSYVSELLFDNGALDVVMIPIYMKKNRPAVRLSVLAKQEQLSYMARLIIEHTSTLGVRYGKVDRFMAKRRIVSYETKFGAIRFKDVFLGDDVIASKPEYDDCVRIAKSRGISLKEVYAEATACRKIGS